LDIQNIVDMLALYKSSNNYTQVRLNSTFSLEDEMRDENVKSQKEKIFTSPYASYDKAERAKVGSKPLRDFGCVVLYAPY